MVEPKYLGPVSLVVEANGDVIQQALSNSDRSSHLGIATLKLLSIHWEDPETNSNYSGSASDDHPTHTFEIHSITHEVVRHNYIDRLAGTDRTRNKNTLTALGAISATIESDIFPTNSTLDREAATLRIWHPDDLGLIDNVKATVQIALWLQSPDEK